MKDSVEQKISIQNLTQQERNCVQQACAVRRNAYAPYSHFFVGAAVLSELGNFYMGSNVERCSYTQTTHAEQNAIDTMIACEGDVRLSMIAIVAAPSALSIEFDQRCSENIYYKHIVGPCGHCRQIIWEHAKGDHDVPILLYVGADTVIKYTIGALLPCSFGSDALQYSM